MTRAVQIIGQERGKSTGLRSLVAAAVLWAAPALAGVLAVPPGAGTATVEGVVVGVDGPLTGARVELHLLVAGSELLTARPRSDASGRFHAEKLPPGAYAVVLRARGHAVERSTRWILDGHNQLGRFQLVPSAVVSGRVVDDAGHPVAAARVRVTPGPGVPGVPLGATADKGGKFIIDGLQDGGYRLQVTAQGHLAAARENLRVPARDVNVRLARLYRVRGLVLPVPAQNARVHIAGSGIWPERSARVSDDGAFEIRRVPAGVYELSATAADGDQALASEVLAGLTVGPFAPPPVLLVLRPGQRLSGVVMQGDRPVSGAMLSLGRDTVSVLRQRVVSDGQGRFSFPPMVHGSYQLGVWAAGFLPVVSRSVALPVELPLRVELSRGCAVRGRVEDPDGRALAGVALRVVYRLGSRTGAVGELGVLPGPVPPIPPAGQPNAPAFAPVGGAGRSDAAGEFSLAGLQPGELQVVAGRAGFTESRSAWLRLAGQETRQLPPLVLRPAGRIAGRVLDERGLGIAGVRIFVAAVRGSWQRTVFSDRRGDYAVDGARGKLVVDAERRGFLPRSVRVSVKGSEDRQLDLALQQARGLVSGYVLDPSRLPVEGARVVARRGKHRVRGRTDRSGFFQLAGVGEQSLQLAVTHPDYVAEQRRVRPGQEVEVRLRYRAGIAGEVTEQYTGAPVQRYTLTLRAAGRQRTVQVEDRRGAFEVRGVTPGTVDLQVAAAGYARAGRSLTVAPAERPHEITAQRIRFVLARAGAVTGRVTTMLGQAVAGALVQVAGLSVRSGADGGFTLRGVPEGLHRLTVSHDGQRVASDPVTVRAGETAGPLRIQFR